MYRALLPALLLPLATVGDQHRALRLAGRIARLADLLHQIQTLDDEREDPGEAAHLAQYDAELRTDQAHIVVTLLAAAHPDRTPDREDFRVVRHEETLLEHGPAPAAIVQLEIAGDDALVLPALEDAAALVPEAELARAQGAEVLRHLRCDIVPHLDQDAPERLAVDFDAEEVDRVDVHGRIAEEGGGDGGGRRRSSRRRASLSLAGTGRAARVMLGGEDMARVQLRDAVVRQQQDGVVMPVDRGGRSNRRPIAERDRIDRVEVRERLLDQLEVEQHAVVLDEIVQLALQEHLLVLRLQPLLLDVQVRVQLVRVGRRLLVEHAEEQLRLRQVAPYLGHLERRQVVDQLRFHLRLQGRARLQDLQQEVALLEHEVLQLGQRFLHQQQIGRDVGAYVVARFRLRLHRMLPMFVPARTRPAEGGTTLEAPQMAVWVGSASGFMSGPVSSVRFQQCTQYSSVPFSSTWLTHLRQK
uniref:Uncharacterized protein n=1 Tax=Anopheles farauti TaxID=69004 RepID=A0A182QT16_9DIPT